MNYHVDGLQCLDFLWKFLIRNSLHGNGRLKIVTGFHDTISRIWTK
jgi:hypothetical protein